MKHLIYIAIQLLVDCIAYQVPVVVNEYLEFSMVNSLVRGGGSNFTLVRQNLWTLLNVWKNVAIYRGEAIMLVKLSIILFSNSHNFTYYAHRFYLLFSKLCSI